MLKKSMKKHGNWLKIEYKLGINKKKPKTKIFEPLRKVKKLCI